MLPSYPKLCICYQLDHQTILKYIFGVNLIALIPNVLLLMLMCSVIIIKHNHTINCNLM